MLEALEEPQAITIVRKLDGTDIELEIVGITESYVYENKIAAEYRQLKKQEKQELKDHTKVPFLDMDKNAACFASACIKDPQWSPLQWLQWGYKNPGRLYTIRVWCMVACRMIDDPDGASLSGVAAAEAKFEEASSDVNPLEQSSPGSVSTSSTSSPHKSKEKSQKEPPSASTTSPEPV